MTSVKVSAENFIELRELFLNVNGGATQHTFSVQQLIERAEFAETQAMALVGNKKMLVGCKYRTYSGGSVANSYKYSRSINEVILVRKNTGWFIRSCEKQTVWATVPKSTLYLTKSAADKAMADYQKQFETMTDEI